MAIMPPFPDRRAAAAAGLLHRVFDGLHWPLTFRLWDGSTMHVGGREESGFTVVFRTPEILKRLLRRPTPLRFGEAFISGEIDIEGDMFAAMLAATKVERMQVPLATRARVLVGLLTI